MSLVIHSCYFVTTLSSALGLAAPIVFYTQTAFLFFNVLSATVLIIGRVWLLKTYVGFVTEEQGHNKIFTFFVYSLYPLEALVVITNMLKVALIGN